MTNHTPSGLSNSNVRIFLAVLLSGGAPLIAQLLGVRFMPAPGYLAAINVPVLACAAVLALIIAWNLTRYELANTWSRKPAWRRRLVFLPIALVVFVTAYLSVAVTLPMAYVALTGQDAEVRVTAGKQSFGPRKICRIPVNLTYPHFIFNTLCGVPRQVRQSVTRGDLLILEGSGNGLGIFYRRVSIAE